MAVESLLRQNPDSSDILVLTTVLTMKTTSTLAHPACCWEAPPWLERHDDASQRVRLRCV